MKILHLSRTDNRPGAPRAAYRLHQTMLSMGIDSLMLVVEKTVRDETVFGPASMFGKIWTRMVPYLEDAPLKLLKTSNLEKHSLAIFNSDILSKVKKIKPDIIQMHWVAAGYLSIGAIGKLNMTAPIVWRLPDMWAFSGAEHYIADGDSRYIEGYCRANRPENEKGIDFNRWVWKRKVRAWRRLKNVTVVCPSKWLAQCAKKSLLFSKQDVKVIHTGVNTAIYKPMNKNFAREAFSLPQNKKIIMIASASSRNARKGLDLFIETIHKLYAMQTNKREIEIVVAGPITDDVSSLPMEVHCIGSLHDEYSMALLYNSADVFVAPSRQENLANTVLEAMACGVPCVAFEVGGMPDVIHSRVNGLLASPFDCNDMANGINWLINSDDHLRTFSIKARETIEERFTLKLQAEQYIKVYNKLMNNK